jgi:predicted acylesterase/phospholipase RssA
MTRRSSRPSLYAPALALAVALLGACAPGQRQLSTLTPEGAYLATGAPAMDPDRIDPEFARYGLIGTMERRLGRPLQILELSGGGQYGAFGAGFLDGWREAGTRPQFDLVTGVSTGALLATHAFLGTQADDQVLRTLYTGIGPNDIYRSNFLGGLFGGPALYRTDPMERQIERAIGPETLRRVADAYDRGRRLFVAATNLDRNEIWVFSLGEIAKRGGPDGLDLYRKVLRAAASPPIVFPPVEIEGHLFADAAVRDNLLIMGLLGKGEARGRVGRHQGEVFVIENGSSDTPPAAVSRALTGIAGHTINATLSGRMHTTLVLAYAGAKLHDYGYNHVSIPASVPVSGQPLAFDTQEMARVYEAGQRLGKTPDPWLHVPPQSDQIGPWAIKLFDHIDRLSRYGR